MPSDGRERGQRGFSPRQLHWAHRNRQQWRVPESIGPLAIRAASGAGRPDPVARAVYEAIFAIADAVFREHCALERVVGNEVVILVDKPEWLYHIRSEWHARLKQHLRQTCPRAAVRRITFKPGNGGAAFTGP
jgi:hypothetical protein